MAMETVLGIAVATGRTLVMPPAEVFYLLDKDGASKTGYVSQKRDFTFADFFNTEAIRQEHPNLEIISMTEFLEKHVVTGKVRGPNGERLVPPNNWTNWDGKPGFQRKILNVWLGSLGHMTNMDPDQCILAFPQSTHHSDVQAILEASHQMNKDNPHFLNYVDKPVPINGTILERLSEMRADRSKICMYNESLQQAQLMHLPTDANGGDRLLIHFYAFLFFQNWKEDLWLKRFIRDHMRYTDEIQCAAARVVEAVRERAKSRGSPDGAFDSIHVRRGDFQFKITRAEPEEILEQLKKNVPERATLFIATDERNKTFFKPIRQVYDVVYLDDFDHVLKGVNTNYYGMIDQLVASRGRAFYGCWFSTFSVSSNSSWGIVDSP
jgi:GDP-fucose protein O-fucosyltransferase